MPTRLRTNKPIGLVEPLHDEPGLAAAEPSSGATGSEFARLAKALRRADPRLGELDAARRGYLLRRLLLVSDLLGLALAYACMVGAYAVAGRDGSTLAIEFVALTPIWVFLAGLVGLYHLSERRVDQSFADEVGPVAMVTTVWAWFLLIANAALSSAPTQLLGPIVAWATAIGIVLCLRAFARRIARGSSWFRQPVLLIGASEDIERVLSRVLRHPELGLDPVAAIRVGRDDYEVQPIGIVGALTSLAAGERIRGRPRPDQIRELIAQTGIGRVMVTGWSESLTERTELMRVLSESGICIDYVSGEPEALYSTAVLHHIEGLPILTIRSTATRVSKLLKRAADVGVSAAGLALLSPVFAYVALRIRISSPGPVLFRQKRAGLDGVTFELLKFRTMMDGADEMRDQLRANDPKVAEMKMLKLRDDPRVTSFGARLRRWSVDELPQLWNVFRGDMSLVGPRPLPLDEATFADGHFAERIRMRPGITGPWQIHGRSDIPFEDMVKLDYMYVASWTMREDLRLLARTVGAVLHGRGAY